MWVRWIRNIREKTSGMDSAERAEYIADYYWYHILLTFLAAALFVLLVYHAACGRRTVSFACVIVNEKPDTGRDRELSGEIAGMLGVDEEKIRVDSDYRISFPGHTEEGSNESDYEKFFFGWSQGELDAVVMTESFYAYCLTLDPRLRALPAEGSVPLPLRETVLTSWICEGEEDPMVLIFPADGKNEAAAEAFCTAIMEQKDEKRIFN